MMWNWWLLHTLLPLTRRQPPRHTPSTLHPPSPGLISGWTYVIQHNGCLLSIYLFRVEMKRGICSTKQLLQWELPSYVMKVDGLLSPWLQCGRGRELSNESCWKLPATDPLNKTSLEDKFQVKGWDVGCFEGGNLETDNELITKVTCYLTSAASASEKCKFKHQETNSRLLLYLYPI